MQSNAGSRGRVGILDVETRSSRRVGSAATVERSILVHFSFFICDHDDVPWLFEGIDTVNVMMVTRVREDLIASIQCAKIYVSVWRGESEDPSFPIVTLFSCHIRFTNS